MTPLQRLLLDRIEADGPISVADYMALALGHPLHGYYRRQDPLGRDGDFTTAPEISQMFGELIGLWCAVSWQEMGCPPSLVLAELGPGRGTLMADLLRAAAMVPGFTAALSIHLVETSPVLRDRQRSLLAASVPIWHEHWSTLPPGPLLVIANEFVDALPIRQFVRRAEGWRERSVGRAGDALCFADGPVAAIAGPPDAVDGDILEVNEDAAALARFVGARIEADGGRALFIDYGHGVQALGDTFQAVRRHAFAPVLETPGEADLTAHVDFATLAANMAPARTFGPITQGLFLTRLGILERAAALQQAHPGKAAGIASGCRRLIDATEMGNLFKVLAVAPTICSPPPGFTV